MAVIFFNNMDNDRKMEINFVVLDEAVLPGINYILTVSKI